LALYRKLEEPVWRFAYPAGFPSRPEDRPHQNNVVSRGLVGLHWSGCRDRRADHGNGESNRQSQKR